MKNSQSLKKNADFQALYKEGKSFANKYLVMYVKENDWGKNRIGISVSKKVGNSVVRHRVKRLILEKMFHLMKVLLNFVVLLTKRQKKKCCYLEDY